MGWLSVGTPFFFFNFLLVLPEALSPGNEDYVLPMDFLPAGTWAAVTFTSMTAVGFSCSFCASTLLYSFSDSRPLTTCRPPKPCSPPEQARVPTGRGLRDGARIMPCATPRKRETESWLYFPPHASLSLSFFCLPCSPALGRQLNFVEKGKGSPQQRLCGAGRGDYRTTVGCVVERKTWSRPAQSVRTVLHSIIICTTTPYTRT